MRAGKARWLLYGLILFWTASSGYPQSTNNGPASPSVRIGPLSIYNKSSADERVALGNDVEIPVGTKVRSVVVIGGNATVEGEVRGEVVVVMGGLKLGPNARVGREVVLIGGPYEEAEGAKVGRERVLITWPRWIWLDWIQDWVRDGLFWARPLPHQHQWAWVLAGVFALGYLMLAAVLPRPLELCREALRVQPGSAFVLGLLAFLLLGPLLLLLIMSVVGLPAMPILLLVFALALFLGKGAVYQLAGCQLTGHFKEASSSWPILGLLLGCLLFSVLYAVPVLGLLVWGLAAMLGLGSVILVLFRGRSAPPQVRGVPPVFELSPLDPLVSFERAGFWIRFWATFLDFLLVGAFLLAVKGMDFAFLAWIAYHFAFWTWRGATIGGILMGIRIVRKDGRPVDYSEALVRCIAALFSAVVVFVGFFWAGWDRDKQSWHDKIAGTLVVRVPKKALV